MGERYRGTLPTRQPQGDRQRPAILSRNRVTLRLTVESVVSNGF